MALENEGGGGGGGRTYGRRGYAPSSQQEGPIGQSGTLTAPGAGSQPYGFDIAGPGGNGGNLGQPGGPGATRGGGAPGGGGAAGAAIVGAANINFVSSGTILGNIT